MYFLIYVLFLHWVADFILQSQWMATNKSHSLRALSTHVLTYGSALALGIYMTGYFDNSLVIKFGVLNTAVHFATDFCTSKVTSRLWSLGRIRPFFLVIGFDQFIHAATLVLTTSFLLGVT